MGDYTYKMNTQQHSVLEWDDSIMTWKDDKKSEIMTRNNIMLLWNAHSFQEPPYLMVHGER
jgi:hypothetical protein